MSSAKSKLITVPQLVEQLKKLFPDTPEMPRMPILECVLLAILRENHPLASALNALEALRNREIFFDWNEIRVSDISEIQALMPDYPDSEARSVAIKKFLKDMYRQNYKFEIEGLTKKTWKEAKDDFSHYQALTNDHHLAHVQVLTFGGHAFPVDNRVLKTLQRLGLAEETADGASVRSMLEKNISKAQILQCIAIFERFVTSYCTLENPHCSECPLNKVCLDYQNRLHPPKPEKKTTKPVKGKATSPQKSKDADPSQVKPTKADQKGTKKSSSAVTTQIPTEEVENSSTSKSKANAEKVEKLPKKVKSQPKAVTSKASTKEEKPKNQRDSKNVSGDKKSADESKATKSPVKKRSSGKKADATTLAPKSKKAKVEKVTETLSLDESSINDSSLDSKATTNRAVKKSAQTKTNKKK